MKKRKGKHEVADEEKEDKGERKAFDSTLFNRAVCVEPPHMWDAYSLQGRTGPLYIVSN